MTAFAEEITGRSGTGEGRSHVYIVRDDKDGFYLPVGGDPPVANPKHQVHDYDALVAVLAIAPSTHAGVEGTFTRTGYSLEEVALNIFRVTINYSTLDGGSPATAPTPTNGSYHSTFEIGLESQNIKISPNTVSRHLSESIATILETDFGVTPPATAPDLGGAINVTADGVDGTDAQVPTARFSLRYRNTQDGIFTAVAGGGGGSITTWEQYELLLENMVGKVNSATFKGRPAGSLRFMGASGSISSDDGTDITWELNFQFEYKKNRTGITIGDIPPFSADGWDFVHVTFEYSLPLNAFTPLQVPTAAYVERLQERDDFAKLGI